MQIFTATQSTQLSLDLGAAHLNRYKVIMVLRTIITVTLNPLRKDS